MKTIVYFHGYGSNSKSDKVARLAARFPIRQILAYDANIDPEIAKMEINDKLISDIITDPDCEGTILFVGTSLGAWLANELSNEWHNIKAVLVNPCYDPANSLKKYGVPKEILDKYPVMDLRDPSRKTIVVDPHDEVIDHTELLSITTSRVIFVENATHRFNGKEWDIVMDLIEELDPPRSKFA